MSREYVLQPFKPPVELKIDYASELNEQQHAAVTAPPGPSLVIAGAGAGKTRTLVYRVAYLLEQGIPPGRVLLLTFTNKAAREMMGRVSELLGTELSDLWGGTFHSIGLRFLRRHPEEVGWRNGFTILDREDARDLLKACMEDAGIDSKKAFFPKVDALADIISKAANTRRTITDILASERDEFLDASERAEALAQAYQGRKQQANVMDFDDLLVQWRRLLSDQPGLCQQYQRQFQFILVDEYQDTNLLQAELVDLLAGGHQNLMVVGDDSQSIYSWRGASFRNILHFPKRYPKAQVFKIETNYRSTPEILELANQAIKANADQFPKELAPIRQSGAKPALVVCEDAGQQSAFIAQRVEEMRGLGMDLNRMAVLYRAHFHALELQLELTRRNIPFSISSGIRFFEQAHIKDVSAWLKLVANPDDEVAFKRIARLIPGIGGKSADRLWARFRSNWAGSGQAPPPEAPEAGAKTPGKSKPAQERRAPGGAQSTVAAACQRCIEAVPAKAAAAWTQFAITLSQVEEPGVKHRPERMIDVVLKAGYKEHLRATYANYETRLEDLQHLAEFAGTFPSTEEFLSQLSLLTNIEAEGDRPRNRGQERLRLSTIHQAKGLEFDAVFIIMLCEGLFPNERSMKKPEDVEEERRLFYVAITRARNELYLIYPRCRGTGGSMGYGQRPSRFLEELPGDLLEQWDLR